MYRKDNKANKIIYIIVNEKWEIQSANIDNQVASQYLKELKVLDKLIKKLPVEYSLEDYDVYIDSIDIIGQVYYLITAILKYPQCKNCRDVLIDTATGLYNKKYLEQIKSGMMFYPSMQNFSLILIDIDDMKAINDELGHLTGDRVIEIVGQAIKNSIRKEDLGIRYGGDEFIVLLSNQKDNKAEKVIDRIRREINKKAVKEELNIQISVGVAYSGDCSASLEDMIEMADKELYIEKSIKKEQKERNSKGSSDLLKELEDIRNKLNGKAIQENKILTSAEILELSQKLDKLIVRYLESI